MILLHLLKNIENDTNKLPQFSEEAIEALKRHIWPGNVRELKNVLERACILFPKLKVSKNNVFENLLRLKVPTSQDEQKALWDATQDIGSDNNEENTNTNVPLPHPKHYADWFDFFDDIDLRVYLRDVEIVLIESALKRSGGTVSKASDLLKINRTTLIEKMKKLQINS